MDNKRGIGTGYVTIMLIFAIICLTIFAVLSFQAAYADERLSERTQEYTRQYYAADASAKELLAALDEIANEARESGFFAEYFAGECADIAEMYDALGGVRAEYSCKINERQSISVSVFFYENMDKGFEIERWQTISTGEDSDGTLGVWDGTFV